VRGSAERVEPVAGVRLQGDDHFDLMKIKKGLDRDQGQGTEAVVYMKRMVKSHDADGLKMAIGEVERSTRR